MIGFFILTAYGAGLFLLCLLLKKRNLQHWSVDDVIFAGGSATSMTLAFSVFSAWLWTTSIFGAIDAYGLYGIWGSFAYACGAAIGFALFIPSLCRIRKYVPEGTTYLDYLQERYGKNTKLFFYIFAFLVSAYVMVEQAVGIAAVMNTFFGSSFKLAAFLSIMLTTGFICISGMRGLLLNEKAAFIVIISGFLFFVIYFSVTDAVDVTRIVTERQEGKDSNILIVHAFRYFIMAIVIAYGQLLLDPAYYLKGKLAKNDKQLKRTFLFSGVIFWGIMCFIISTYLGWASVSQGVAVTDLFIGGTAVYFSVIITFVGMGTVAHFLIGLLGVFTTDYYTSFLRPDATEKQKLVFGRVMTIAVGIFCALVAISLENISLLTIDSFCAIFFAAPCGAVIIGLYSKGNRNNMPIMATFIGIIAGIIVWVFAADYGMWSQLAGMGVSLFLPVVVLLVGEWGQLWIK